jgi:5-methylcytosine-specific restriction enzyme A
MKMNKRTWSDGKRLTKEQGGYQWMYDTKHWRLRRLHQLQQQPLCEACLADNTIRAAKVVHHVIDHRGDWDLFCDSPLQSLCKQCHDNIWQGSDALGYQRGCDISGAPYKTNPIFIDKNRGKRRGA